MVARDTRPKDNTLCTVGEETSNECEGKVAESQREEKSLPHLPCRLSWHR